MNTIRRSRPLLGTFVEISVWDEDKELAQHAISAAFKEIERVQELLSSHIKTSEISLINSSETGSKIKLSATTFEVLKIAESVFHLSDGLFDVVFSPGQRATFKDISLIDGGFIQLNLPVKIDLGGIGKGFAVDKAASVLKEFCIKNALVSAGGDMLAFGDMVHKIFIRDPKKPENLINAAEIQNRSFATSANYFRSNGQGCDDSGIRNPIDGLVWESVHSVSVSATTCTLSDALTKVVALKGISSTPLLSAAGAYGIYYDGQQMRYI